MTTSRTCDGVRRRDFLQAGVLGGLGLHLAQYLQLAQAGQVVPAAAQAGIFINLQGGPSHMDTFDLKPGAEAAYRGEFNPIATSVAGVEISEHLPKTAQQADKFTILRGVSHTLAAHALGQEYLLTGTRPNPSVEYPGYGSVVSKELASPPDLPPYIAIPNTPQGGGFLGVEYAPLQTNGAPKSGKPFNLRGISLPGSLTVEAVAKREQLRKNLDTAFRGFESQSEVLTGLDRFAEQAQEIITSKKAREAFDVARESPGVVARFGETPFATSCLLATRLVEAGVRFVTVSFGGWDTHRDNFNGLKTKKLPELDAGLAALFQTLAEKGLLSSTAVFVTGEFGRTPKINPNAGRDHWPRAMFVLLGGGGLRGGQVVGSSDANGMGPAAEAIAPDDVAATFYRSLGIDPKHEYKTSIGRPITLVREGKVIPDLL